MTKTTLLTGLIFVGMSLGLAACGPIVPLNPTWKDDVRPLVVARCVRCHDNPGHKDPTIADKNPNTPGPDAPASNFNEPPDVVLSPAPPAGLLILGVMGASSARGTSGLRRMPPAPAAALEDWQIEILDAWGSSNPLR